MESGKGGGRSYFLGRSHTKPAPKKLYTRLNTSLVVEVVLSGLQKGSAPRRHFLFT